MIKNILIILSGFLCGILPLYAEGNADAGGDVILKVMTVSLVIWLGLGIFIYYLNRKVKRLEKKIDEK